MLHFTPATFDVSVWEILGPLSMGARLVIAPPDVQKDSARLVELHLHPRHHGPPDRPLALAGAARGACLRPLLPPPHRLRRRGDADGPAGPRVRAVSRARALQRLRPHRDLHRRHVLDLPARGSQRRRRPHRPADRERAGVHPRSPSAAGPHRHAGRPLSRRAGARTRIPRPARAHRGFVRAPPLRRPDGAAVQDRRPRALARERRHRIPRPERQPNQAARPTHRAR